MTIDTKALAARLERYAELKILGLIPESLRYDPLGQFVVATEDYHRFCDMRGWGYLTGGGVLQLDQETAAAVQDARGEYIASTPAMASDLRLLQGVIAELVGALEARTIKLISEGNEISVTMPAQAKLSGIHAKALALAAPLAGAGKGE